MSYEINRKWRTIVDGDTWFFCKRVTGGRFGAMGNPAAGVAIFLHSGSGRKEGSNIGVGSEVKFTLNKHQAQEFLNAIQECWAVSVAADSEKWGKEGTFIIKEVVTEHDAVIHVSSLYDGTVMIKFITYDSKGVDYLRSAVGSTVSLNTDGVKEFTDILKTAIDNTELKTHGEA